MSCWRCGNLNLVMDSNTHFPLNHAFWEDAVVIGVFCPKNGELTEFFITWNDAETVCFSNVEHTFSRHTMWLPFESREYIIRKTCACHYGRTHVRVILMMIIDIAYCFPTLRHSSFSLSHESVYGCTDALGHSWAVLEIPILQEMIFQLGGLTTTIYIDLLQKSQPAFCVADTTDVFLWRFLPKKIVFPSCFLEVVDLFALKTLHMFFSVPKTHHSTV